MKIRYRSNLAAGILALAAALVLFLLIPSQVSVENRAVYGVTSRSLPYALVVLTAGAGAGLIFESLVLKKDQTRELELAKEGKALLYMLVLLAYAIGFSHSFLISTVLLGAVTLALARDKKPLHYAVVTAMAVVIYFAFTQLLHVRLP